VLGVSNKNIHAVCTYRIEQPQIVENRTREMAGSSTFQITIAQVLEVKIPGVTDRAMYVADVQLIRCGEYTFGYHIAGRNHDVVAGQIVLLNSVGRQRQVVSVFTLSKR